MKLSWRKLIAAMALLGVFSGMAQTNAVAPAKKLRVVLVGDSTVNDAGGWGYGFKQFLNDEVVCFNVAANGRSSKSFIAEGRWARALALHGDYYLIQFGHNDEPGKGPARETDPETTYAANLARYVDEARAIGGKPVLVTSLTRRIFDAAGSGKLQPSLLPYVAAMKKVAAQKGVPLLDLHARSVEYCERIGPAATAQLNPSKDGKPDTTHLNAAGRLVFARLVVAELRSAVPELAPYLLAEPNAAAVLPRVFDVRKFGASGNGTNLDTVAIQAALDACAQAGGGVVQFPAGTYLCQPIFLKGNGLTVQLEAGAKLQATDNFDDFYNPEKPGAPLALVNASGLTDLTLKGPGIIDGAGEKWWAPVKAAKRAGTAEARKRPRLVLLQQCLNLRVEELTLQNSPSFHLVPSDCEEVTITGVTIQAPADAPNTDALDPSACRHVRIRRCTFNVGDDNIAIKSGHVDAAHPNAAVEDVVVEDCTFLAGHGLSIGSETVGGVKNLQVRNCTFDGTTSGIRIKSDRTRGGVVDGCTYSNLVMHNVKLPINITSYYPKVPATDTAQPITDKTPVYRHLKIVNLTATGPASAGFIVGLPECCVTNVIFENVRLTARKGLTVRHAQAVNFINSKITTESGEGLILETNAEVTGLK